MSEEEGKRKHDEEGGTESADSNKRVATDQIPGAEDGSAAISTTIKILCSNKAVGQVIGRAGAMINSIKEASGAHVKVSSTGEVYPGTMDRIVMISGTTNSVLSAAHLVVTELSKQQADGSVAEVSTGEMVLTIALPASACGLVIGKGGERINVLREQCSCKMHMQSKDQAVRGVQERTITVTGGILNVQTAVEKIILLLTEDGTVHYENATTNYGGAGKSMMPGMGIPGMGMDQMHRSGIPSGILGDVNALQVQMRLAIPESTVGTLVGKGGSTIKEIIAIAGCQVKVSQKGDVVPGTTNRIVTIVGNAITSAYAQALVLQRVPEAQHIS